jgi:hypothetical protein
VSDETKKFIGHFCFLARNGKILRRGLTNEKGSGKVMGGKGKNAF